MRWGEFERACPELARIGRERFEKDELVVIGTIRKDGWPRVSPNEVDLAAGRLFLGMMPRSVKALDLLRDPRVVVHTVTCNRLGTDGDLKLYGRAVQTHDPELVEAYKQAIEARIDWRPEGEFHCFEVDIERAAYVRFEDGRQRIVAWSPEAGLRERVKAA